MDTERVSDKRLADLAWLANDCPDFLHLEASRELASIIIELQSRRAAQPAGEVERLREALAEIARLRLATDEGTLRERADRMWSIAEDRKQ